MLKYDEWAVPGEVEYAKKKAAEIELQIQKWHKDFFKKEIWKRGDTSFSIRLTEHVAGEFGIKLPESVWLYAHDIDISNAMILDWYRDMVAPIDEPKIFDIPAEDVRSRLPEWDDSFLTDDTRGNIMEDHSIRYHAVQGIEKMDGDYSEIQREFKLSDAKCSRIMDTFVKNLKNKNKQAVFTELEEKIGKYFTYRDCRLLWPHWNYYEPWFFALAMSEKDILDAVHEAYLNACKRSRRMIPDKFDYTNLSGWFPLDEFDWVENYECLYQGRAKNLVIRFLFNYKDMKIMTAYPVLKDRNAIIEGPEYCYYDNVNKFFNYGKFEG